MAGLQRFVSYIFKYENNEKKENAGFAKIEIRGSRCRMEVHINTEHAQATVYLFVRNGENIQGIPIPDAAAARGRGGRLCEFHLAYLDDFGVAMGNIEGIYIPLDDDRFLASQWKEGTLRQAGFQILEKIQTQEEAKGRVEDAPGRGEETERKEEGSNETAQSQDRAKQPETGNGQKEQPIQATELPLEEFISEREGERAFRKFRLKSEIFFPFEGEEIECVRMQLNDIQELPKKYWYLGKNSFLLHGFFNYRHIILGEIEEDGKKEYFVGVPGVFQNQERIMASIFGFPEFRTAKNVKYKTGNFGYWYRII